MNANLHRRNIRLQGLYHESIHHTDRNGATQELVMDPPATRQKPLDLLIRSRPETISDVLPAFSPA